MKKKVTDEMIQQMKELRGQGFTDVAIGEALGVVDKTVAYYLGKNPERSKDSGRRMTKREIDRMHELRDQGLSNSQIAIELKTTLQTVTRHIGTQKKGARAAYGSLKTHADGESFARDIPTEPFRPLSARIAEAPEQEPEWVREIKTQQAAAKKPDIFFGLRTIYNVATYQGQDLRYKVDSSGRISIWEKQDREETALQLSFDQFNKMLEEMLQLIDKIPA